MAQQQPEHVKIKRAVPLTLSLSNAPDGIHDYFLETPYYDWSATSFCRRRVLDIPLPRAFEVAASFLQNAELIRGVRELHGVIRSTAKLLSKTDRASIIRVWNAVSLEQTRSFDESNQFGGTETSRCGDNSDEDCALSDETQNSTSNKKVEGEFPKARISDNSSQSKFIPDDEYRTEKIKWIEGPGTSSSQLGTTHLWIDKEFNISERLVEWRDNAMRALDILEDADLLVLRNFIYSPRIVQDVLSIGQWTEAISRWGSLYPYPFSVNDVVDIYTFSVAVQSRSTYQDAMRVASTLTQARPMTSILSNYIRTGEFWSVSKHDQLFSKPVDKDTFITNAIKPVMSGLFGDLPHINLHWTRSEIKCGDEYNNEEKLYPDFHIYIKDQSIVLLEAKPPGGTATEYMEDRRKLFDEMKLAVDGLLQRGIDEPVVGFLVTGYHVEVFAMKLEFEACYLPVDLGSFDLVGSRFQFGNLMAAAKPLLTARSCVSRTITALTGVKKEAIKSTWTRGSYHTKPLIVNPQRG
ncbi:hypothetical protein BGW38_007199 [Lunasporangiospora selenospora]|uniref:Uncharacterized protein n=1 Tax=Lunasporangiospora selenospora TaxID=979761 RepID=A0A9P6FLQ1_9FUNG|nr:hypothetical protein BGW38_007199 [Lunasporangiospora selenospora]